MQRSLRSFLDTAKDEESPLSTEAVREIVVSADLVSPGSSLMYGIISSSVVVAVVSGIVGLTTLSTDPSVVQERRVSPTASTTNRAPAPEITLPSALAAVLDTSGFTSAIQVCSYDGPALPEGVLHCMRLDDVPSIDVNVEAIEQFLVAMSNADSVAACATGSICIWENGKRLEIPFGGNDTQLPAMITLPSGQGRFITDPSLSGVDVNDLIPMETETESGKVVVWFPPTESIVMRLPDNIASELRVLQSNLAVLRKNLDTRLTDVDEQLVDMNVQLRDMDVQLKNMDAQLTDIDAQPANFEVKVFRFTDSVVSSNLCHTPMTDTLVLNSSRVVSDSVVKKIMANRTMILRRFDSSFVSPTSKIPKKVDSNSRVKTIRSSKVIIMRRPAETVPPTSVTEGSLQESRWSDGALTMESVYPNPSQNGSATVTLRLTAERTVTVELFDMAGGKVATLVSLQHKPQGTSQIMVPITNISPGMYLLSLVTERGERTMRRFVVQ